VDFAPVDMSGGVVISRCRFSLSRNSERVDADAHNNEKIVSVLKFKTGSMTRTASSSWGVVKVSSDIFIMGKKNRRNTFEELQQHAHWMEKHLSEMPLGKSDIDWSNRNDVEDYFISIVTFWFDDNRREDFLKLCNLLSTKPIQNILDEFYQILTKPKIVEYIESDQFGLARAAMATDFLWGISSLYIRRKWCPHRRLIFQLNTPTFRRDVQTNVMISTVCNLVRSTITVRRWVLSSIKNGYNIGSVPVNINIICECGSERTQSAMLINPSIYLETLVMLLLSRLSKDRPVDCGIVHIDRHGDSIKLMLQFSGKKRLESIGIEKNDTLVITDNSTTAVKSCLSRADNASKL
jgi:hypothetical protein